MKTQTRNSLVEFYFGTMEETRRLQIEKELLLDPEMLLDYLDLKRELESAAPVPHGPSPFLWRRLQPLTKKRKWQLAGFTALIAASFACLYIFASYKGQSSTPNNSGLLFDSSPEHSFASDVL